MRTRRSVFSFIALFALASASGLAAGPADPTAVAPRIDAPVPGPGVPLTTAIEVGHARIVPGEGATVRPLWAGETRCGVLVEGPLTLRYRVADAMSVPVARRNARKASHMRASAAEGGALELVEPLEGAVLWGWALPEAGGGAPRGGGLPAWAARIVEDPLFPKPSEALLAARALGGTGLVYGLMHGSKDELGLLVDPVMERLETLLDIDRVSSAASVDNGRFIVEEIAAQPLGRRWWDRAPASLVAVDEDLKVVNDHGEHVVVDATMKLASTRDGVGVWWTNLADRVVVKSRAYPVTIRTLEVDGRPARYLHRNGELLVFLDPPVARRGDTVTVHVVSEGPLAQRPKGDSYWSLGTWPWYPQPGLDGELATVRIRVEVPEPLTPFASGTTVARTTANGRNVLETRIDHPVQFPVIAAGRYTVYSDEKDGVRCEVASYVFGKKKACRRLIQNFFAASEVYGRLFHHPYPFDEMHIVEVNAWGFGQAPPGVIFITKEAYNPLGGTINQLFSQGVNERFVHEIAHSWWGSLVKMDSLDEQWLTESFAEYSAALCLQIVAGGGKKGDREFRKLLDHWKAQTAMIGEGGSIYLANHLAMDDSADMMDRTRLLYSKGPLVLHALRLELRRKMGGEKEGDRYFFALLRSFVKNFPYRWGATRHLVGILDQITHENWQPWFDRYVYGCETPKL